MMGSKTDGFKCDYLFSKCCNKPIRFEPTNNGYSISSWCSECGNYIFTGRTEGLLAFWLGNYNTTIKMKGYLPEWFLNLVRNVRVHTQIINDITNTNK